MWLLDAATPDGELTVVAPRRPGVEYSVEHQALEDGSERLLILHNDGAQNFELATAPVDRPAEWTTFIAAREDTRLLGVDAFNDFLTVYLRRDGLTGLRILRADGSVYDVAFPEPVYTVSPGGNPDPAATLYRLRYTSLVTPDSVYDCDVATGTLLLRRRQPVLPLPGDGEPRVYNPGDYEQFRDWATAPDGARMPISLVCRRAPPRDGSAPGLLYGYGSYEISMDPRFSLPGCPCWTAASSTRSGTSAAAANSAAPGTTTARCCTRPTPSLTSWPARGTWRAGAGHRRTGSWPAVARPAAC